jgi:branched-chain amino acid transport system permease protein
MFLIGWLHVRGRAGRAWAAIRQSESAAIAAGVNVTLYKLWAFTLASFMTGVAGCLLAASAGGLTTYAFPAQDSITLLAVVLMGGIFTFWGPLVAALLLKFLPELLKNWGMPADLLLILFGIGVLQAMLTAPAGLAVQVPKDLANLGKALAGVAGRAR